MLGLGIGLMGRGGGAYDADDLSQGTLKLDFVSVNELTLDLNLIVDAHRAWDDDPSWPYGAIGVFQRKG